jgi:hypothetical protein
VTEAVKSRRVLTALGAALGICAPTSGLAQGLFSDPPSPPRPSSIALDPWLPTGAELAARTERPVEAAPPGCSFVAPVCVHRGAGVPAQTARGALQALEQAFGRLVGAMRLPQPLPDHRAGGGPELDLYLRAGRHAKLVVEHDFPDASRFDRAPAFCVLHGADRSLLERDASLCVAEAIAWRLDASTTPHVRRAYATHLWLASNRPSTLDAQALDDLQSQPELAVVTRDRTARSEGAAIFFEHLDQALGASHPGVLATALLASAAEKTPPGAWQWDNEPDVMDVLRHTAGTPRAMAELMGDFAISRAFIGDRSDGRIPALDWAGAFGRVRFDWVIPFSSLPRRVMAARPLEPTGSIYIWLALDRVSSDATLGFQAVWEPPVAFRWTLVRVAPDGRELGRLHPAFQERGTQVEQTLVDLTGAAGILVVGTNLGGVELKHPFDPDVAPFEPHACTVYLAKL